MGANAQVALEKFARYFEVEARILPVSAASNWCLDPNLVRDNIDENTIGVFVILGSTYTGHFEPVEEVAQILDEFQKETGHDIPIHVDGASGAMVAPFTHNVPKWGFEIPRVVSINTSGHKFVRFPRREREDRGGKGREGGREGEKADKGCAHDLGLDVCRSGVDHLARRRVSPQGAHL